MNHLNTCYSTSLRVDTQAAQSETRFRNRRAARHGVATQATGSDFLSGDEHDGKRENGASYEIQTVQWISFTRRNRGFSIFPRLCGRLLLFPLCFVCTNQRRSVGLLCISPSIRLLYQYINLISYYFNTIEIIICMFKRICVLVQWYIYPIK
jgi:hypothetical protein